jgi:hypothetical protein
MKFSNLAFFAVVLANNPPVVINPSPLQVQALDIAISIISQPWVKQFLSSLVKRSTNPNNPLPGNGGAGSATGGDSSVSK